MKKLRTIKDLKQDAKNANSHTAKGKKLLEKSLKDLGAGRSILADKDGNIIAGNATAEQAAALGYKKIRVVETTGDELVVVQRTDLSLDSAKARKLAIMDNRVSEIDLSWNPEALASFNLDLGEMFDDKALRGFGLQKPIEAPEPQLDKADELQKKWKTKRGQIWEIGKHRLMCGDCTQAEEVATLMGGAKAQMLFTDPPYGVGYTGQRISSGKFVANKHQPITGDSEDSGELYRLMLIALLPHLDDSAAFYIWFAASHSLTTYTALRCAGLRAKALIIWHKINTGFGNLNHHYKQKHEPCIYASKIDKAEKWYGPNNEVTVWDVPKLGDNDLHPTMKPLELPVRAIRNSSAPGDLVVDLFLGAAGTAVAAQQLGRVCYGMEIEPKYVAVALERMADMGLKPKLL